MPFESTIDNNNKITNDFKQIVKECFSSIYETLGKNNFKRWIHTREVSKDIEELIFDWMTEEDKENEPNSDGFTKTDSSEIRIRRSETAKDTSIHELYHLITRHSKRFSIYINEGMTEYLKGMTSEKGSNSYMDNVKMVEFLHKMLGDFLIKAYLLGKDESFDRKFAETISQNEEKLPEAEKEINEFYKTLDKRHKLLYPITKDEIKSTLEEKESKQHEFDETTNEMKNMIRKIILGKTHQMAQDLEFYQDGKITNLIIVSEWINSIPHNLGFSFDERHNLLRKSIETILDDSHLLLDLDRKDAYAKKTKILNSIISTKTNADGTISQINYQPQQIEQFNEERQDIVSKIFQKSFEGSENVSLMDFVDKTLKIATHIRPSERELKALISQYAISIFGEKVDISLVDSLVKQNLDRYQQLFDVEKKREKDTIESQYRKIDDNSYIEKKDNQYFYVKIDEKGIMVETEIRDYSREYDSETGQTTTIEKLSNNDTIVRKLNEQEQEKIKRRVYRIAEGQKVINISLKNGLESLQIHGKEDKYQEFGIMDIKEFRKIEMITPILQQIREKIKNGSYQTILEDAENPYTIKCVTYTSDIDARSRKISFVEFRQDLNKIRQLLRENEKGEILQSILIDELLDRTFGTIKKEQKDGEFVRSENEQKAYDEIKKSINQNDLENDGIENAITVLNNSRKERIEENKKHTLIHFMTPEAEEEYLKHQKLEKSIEQSKTKFELEQELARPGSIPIGRYFEKKGEISEELQKKTENIAFGLKGVALVGPNIDDRSRKLLVDKLCEDLALKTGKITNLKDKKQLLGRYIETVLNHVYDVSWKSKKENEQIQESYENISGSIIENIINGTEIDEELMESSTAFLDEDRKKRVREENEKSGHLIWIKDKTTRLIYEQLVDLSKKIPQSQLDIVTQGLVNAANKEYDKGERDEESK